MESSLQALLDSRQSFVPNINRELYQTVIDQINGQEPTTTLGVLLQRSEATTLELLAGHTGKSLDEIDWTIELLEREDLCVRITSNGVTKAIAHASHSREML